MWPERCGHESRGAAIGQRRVPELGAADPARDARL